jgi:hypothetical protein
MGWTKMERYPSMQCKGVLHLVLDRRPQEKSCSGEIFPPDRTGPLHAVTTGLLKHFSPLQLAQTLKPSVACV